MLSDHLSKSGRDGFEIDALSYLLLTFTGGFFDVYTYLIRGGVFANAHTGNLVLIGVSIAEGKDPICYLIPVISFILGVLTAHLLKDRIHGSLKWLTIILAIETAVIFAVGMLPEKEGFQNLSNICVSFITAIQYGAFRKLGDYPFATTMCTGMLRSAADHLNAFLCQKDKSELVRTLSYFAVVMVFISGALFGSLMCSLLREKAVWICGLVFIAVIADNYIISHTKKKGRG